ncbi:uncharacterized [Tachysurus ichikawai]
MATEPLRQNYSTVAALGTKGLANGLHLTFLAYSEMPYSSSGDNGLLLSALLNSGSTISMAQPSVLGPTVKSVGTVFVSCVVGDVYECSTPTLRSGVAWVPSQTTHTKTAVVAPGPQKEYMARKGGDTPTSSEGEMPCKYNNRVSAVYNQVPKE